jgi:cytidine deaminase
MKTWVKDFCLKTAAKSTYQTFRHGAVLESGGRIIAFGCNMYKSCNPYSSMSTQAETVPLKRAITMAVRNRRNAKFNIYVARVNKQNEPKLSKPCPKCLQALQQSGIINTIHFTTDSGWSMLEL